MREVVLLKLIRFIFSGEFVFAAFLLASVFKSALPIGFIDTTLFFFMWSVLIALKRLFNTPKITRAAIIPLTLFSMLLAVFTISYIYTPSEVYGAQKLMMLFSLTSWALIGTFVLITNKESLQKFLVSFMSIILITSLYVLTNFFLNSNDVYSQVRIGVEGSNYLGLGRAAALGALIVIFLYLFNSNVKNLKKIFAMFLLGVLLLTLMLTGARMALLSLILIIVVFLMSNTFKLVKGDVLVNKKSIKIFFSLIPVPLLLIPFQDSVATMFLRLSTLTNSSGHGSYTQRFERFSLAFEMWKDSVFLGKGIGSYAIYFNGIDQRYYPHNILFELVSEVGVIGLLIFLVLLITPFFLTNVFKANNLQICIILLLTYAFLNANTTGDINDNRMVFTFLALLYMFPLFNKGGEAKKVSDELTDSQ